MDQASKVISASRQLDVKADEFVLFYYRPDETYSDWNLWLWKQGGSGSRYDFTGVQNGVAFFKSRRDLFFDAASGRLGFIVRTDAWQKDPDVDRHYFPSDGARCAVFSGDSSVYSIQRNRVKRMVRSQPEPRPAPDLSRAVIQKLPEPVLDRHPAWIDLYWAVWKFMHEKISAGNTANGFVPTYIDEGFNENIYQWDSCFMVAYAIYGLDVFPAMPTLDNFYGLQRKTDGYICRTYNETTGHATGENDINPPLFAWMEWRYYKLTGDTSRIERVLNVLDVYFDWVKTNARSAHGNGLYFITDLGSGMDNSPREEYIRKGAWIDLSSQQALAALYLHRLAGVGGNAGLRDKYTEEYRTLKSDINRTLWNAEHRMYFDRTESGEWHIRNTIASFWPMIAEVAEPDRAGGLIEGHLKNPDEFYRPHLFPTLAANDPVYDSHGHYWRGAVWAPTNFAVIKGIALYDPAFAREASINHIENMSRVYRDFEPSAYPFKMPDLTEPNIPRNGNGIRQIWEAYSPDDPAPATRWDARLLVRQKFCGWSGLGPVALLIEEVLGFDVDAPSNTITWRINFTERHGIKRLKFGNRQVTLIAEARKDPSDPLTITGSASHPFRLVVHQFDSAGPVYDQTVPASRRLRIRIQP